MTAQRMLSEIVKGLTNEARRFDFVVRGQTMRREEGDIVGIIAIDRDRSGNSKDRICFGLTMNVCHMRYHHVVNRDPYPGDEIGSGLFNEDTGSFRGFPRQRFPWVVDERANVGNIIDDAVQVLRDVAIPTVAKLLSEQDFKNYLADLVESGDALLTHRLCLCMLLKEFGESSELKKLVEDTKTEFPNHRFAIQRILHRLGGY